jgi:hypothetical protein
LEEVLPDRFRVFLFVGEYREFDVVGEFHFG